ncbi:hypothetical protein K0A97_02640 [Patescibacteria group bacterium]|nr:hypothetical protein [Patescibacteria group bacterium]
MKKRQIISLFKVRNVPPLALTIGIIFLIGILLFYINFQKMENFSEEENLVIKSEKLLEFKGNLSEEFPEGNLELTNCGFNLFIEVQKAEHLDSKKNFVSDIYKEIKELDGLWSPKINNEEYVRVVFKENLSSSNYIKVYPKIISGDPKIDVYEMNQENLIGTLNQIRDYGSNDIYLTELKGVQDSFDLRIREGILAFNYIVDPIAYPNGSIELRARECALQSLQVNRDTFDLSCGGSYPSSCGTLGDRVSCDDLEYETAQSTRQGGTRNYGGVRVTSYNPSILNCGNITSVEICYKFWGAPDGDSICYVDVSNDSGTTWSSNTLASCYVSEPTSVECINVTSNFSWQCSNFFGSTGTRAMARTQAYGANNRQTRTWSFDVLFFNVSYEARELNEVLIGLNSPSLGDTISSYEAIFNYTPFSLEEISNCSLWDNSTGNWQLSESNQSLVISGEPNYINKTYSQQGAYLWNIQCYNNLGVSSFSESNLTFNLELPIKVLSVQTNSSLGCGTENYVKVTCEIEKDFGEVDAVRVLANGPLSNTTYPSIEEGEGFYYSNVLLDEIGNWSFVCIANDTLGYEDSLPSTTLINYPLLPNLILSPSNIWFSNEDPIEKETVNVSVLIKNMGCYSSGNFSTGLFEGDPSENGKNVVNHTTSLEGLGEKNITLFWNANIGNTNLFVYANFWDEVQEYSKTENQINKTISVTSWQVFHGNVSIEKILSDSELKRLSAWENGSIFGNIFITDQESNIDWSSLKALGRNLLGEISTNDFLELDGILGMENFEDNLTSAFTSNGTEPLETQTFQVHNQEIFNVPIINSTISSNFITGIMWDASKDTDGKFGMLDNEEVVFITKIDKSTQGGYGIYDYEIRIPVRLREYHKGNIQDLFIYFDIL